MKFSHIADCHIGGWSNDKLKNLGILAFERSIDVSISKNVDFIVLAGDLFNTALPSIDYIKETTRILKKLKDSDIPCYIIPGSHDYSPSGKTMLGVLEEAGLVVNVVKLEDLGEKIKLNFTVDEKTGVKITGLFGKRGGLEKSYYEILDRTNLEQEEGKKIFLFHTTLTEFKPEHLEMISSEPVAILPKGFSYYAGGHPHFIFNEEKIGYGRIAYTGALFPNNFAELEKFKGGGFWLNEFVNDEIKSEYVEVKLKEVDSFVFDVAGKTPHEAENYILDHLNREFHDRIVLIRVKGILKGKPSDLDFKNIEDRLKNCFVFLKNTSKLVSEEIEEIEMKEGDIVEIENEIKGKLGEYDVDALMKEFDKEKDEGEKNFDFESRIVKDVMKVLGIEIE